MEGQRRGFGEEARERQPLGVADLMRYFIAGHICVDPSISSERLVENISREFSIGREDVMVFGDAQNRNVWVNPAVSQALSDRFGGRDIPQAMPLDEQLG